MDLTFPARDERFGTVATRLSEPTAAPRGENFLSNEDSYPRVADELRRLARPGGVYLGVGPDQNFTLMAHARPALAFVLDFRPRNRLVHLLHKALSSLAPNRVNYLQRLTCREPAGLPTDPSPSDLVRTFRDAPFDRGRLAAESVRVAEVLQPLGLLDAELGADLALIQARLAGPGLDARFLALPMYPTLGRLLGTTDGEGHPAHFLATEAAYQRVRSLQRGDRVIPLVADFAGDRALPALAAWLRARSFAVSTFYVSDVEFFLLRNGRFAGYVENLGHLPWAEGALIVRTSTREIDHPARRAGDSSTTVVTDAARFLDGARRGLVRTPDDLFPRG